MSRSSGATLLFELGFFGKVIHFGYFNSGLFRRNHDPIFLHSLAIHMYCFASLRKKKRKKETIRKKKKKKRKKEREKTRERIVANK